MGQPIIVVSNYHKIVLMYGIWVNGPSYIASSSVVETYWSEGGIQYDASTSNTH